MPDVDQLPGRVHADRALGLVVTNLRVERAADHTAGLVEIAKGHLNRLGGSLSILAGRAGHRDYHATGGGAGGPSRCAAGECDGARRELEQLLHSGFPPGLRVLDRMPLTRCHCARCAAPWSMDSAAPGASRPVTASAALNPRTKPGNGVGRCRPSGGSIPTRLSPTSRAPAGSP